MQEDVEEQQQIAVDRIRRILKSSEYQDFVNHYSAASLRFRDLPSDIKLTMYYQIYYGAGKLEDSLALYHDVLYDRRMVDIDTFLSSPEYMGVIGGGIYPRWKAEMRDFLSSESVQREWVFSGSIGTGKSLVHGTPVKVVTGWKPIEDVVIGDRVDSGFGQFVDVTGVFPQGERDVYKVTFADGRASLCCEEHLWLVLNDYSQDERVLPTKQIREQLLGGKLYIPVYTPHQNNEEISLSFEHSQKVINLDGLIPDVYINASFQQKLKLLKWLFNNNGVISKSGKITYTTSKKQLAVDIQSLIWSIGGICEVKTKVKKGVVVDYAIYTLYVNVSKQTDLFSLPKKVARCVDSNQCLKLQIKSIEKLPYSAPMTCLSVSGEKSTYVVDDYIITHNTTISRIISLYRLYQMSCLRHPQETFGLTSEATISMVFISINKIKSREAALKPFVSLMRMCSVFEEVNDQNKLLTYTGKRVAFNYNIGDNTIRLCKNISITIGSSIDDLISMNVFCAFYDEAEAGGNPKAVLDLYHEMKTRIKSRFGVSQFNYASIISSARKQNGAIQTYLSKLDEDDKPYVRVSEFTKWEVATAVGSDPYADGAFYVLNGTINYPSTILTDEQAKRWIDYPDEAPAGTEVLKIPITYLRDFKLNLERSLQDIAGVPTATNGIPFPDTTKIVDKRLCRSLRMKAPITTYDSTEVITKLINNLPPECYIEHIVKGKVEYKWHRYPNAIRYMSLDLAEVNEAALAMVHKEKNADGEAIIVVDLIVTFYTNTRIRLDSIWDFMCDFRKKFNFRIHTASFDQYQSAVFRQRAAEMYFAENNILLSVDRSPDAYLHLANLVARGGFKIGDCPDIKLQMGAITEDESGKIVKPYVTEASHCDGLDTLVAASYCAHLNNADVPSLIYLPEDTPIEVHQEQLVNATMKRLKLSW